jgi:hypothetical protein
MDFQDEQALQAVALCTQAIASARGASDMDLDAEEQDRLVQLYIYRAFSYLVSEQYTAAAADVKTARRIKPADLRLMPLQQKIEMAVSQATTKDYYKILGVSRYVEPDREGT